MILTHILEAHDPQAALQAARRIFRGSFSWQSPSSSWTWGPRGERQQVRPVRPCPRPHPRRRRLGVRDHLRFAAGAWTPRRPDIEDRTPLRSNSRGPRIQPGDEARPADAALATAHRRGAGREPACADGAGLSEVRSPRPASSTCASPRPGWRTCWACRAAGERSAGSDPDAAAPQRGVRVGQPDRAAHRRQRARRVRGRPAVPRPRGRRPTRDPRVLLQRLRAPRSDTSARRVGAPSARRAGARGRLPGRLRGDARARSCPEEVWARAPGATGADRDGSSAPGRPSAVRGRIEASLARLGVHFDVWKSEASPPRRGLGRAGRRAAARRAATSTSRTAPSGSAPPTFGDDKDRVDLPLERRAHVLRRGHRLRHREVQPRLRPPHLHLGRGPPRHRRPRAQRRRGDGLRPGRRRDAPHGLGPLRAGRRRGLDDQARRRVRHARRAARRGGHGRRPLVLRVARGQHVEIDFDIELAKKQSAENPVYYVQYAHARIARSCARRPRRGSRRQPAWPARSPATPEAALARERLRAARRSWRTRPRPRRRRASRRTRRSSRPTFHAFYRDRRVVDPDEPEPSAARRPLAIGQDHPQRPGPAGDLRARVDVAASRRDNTKAGYASRPSCAAVGGAGSGAADPSPRPSDSATRPRDSVAGRGGPAPGWRRQLKHQRGARVRPGRSAMAALAAVSNCRRPRAVPLGLPHDGPRTVGAIETDEAVATPAGRGVGLG